MPHDISTARDGTAPDGTAPAGTDLADPAQTRFMAGLASYSDNDTERAIDNFRQAIRLAPRDGALRLALGESLLVSDRLAEALPELMEAAHLRPDLSRAWASLGDAFMHAGMPERAVPAFRTAIARANPPLASYHHRLGIALLALGQWTEGMLACAAQMAYSAWALPDPPPPDGRLRVAVLWVAAPGNMPIDYILNQPDCQIDIVCVMEGFNYPFAEMAAVYDIVFCAVADPDVPAHLFDRAAAIAAGLGLPLVNSPALVAGTGREQIARRLDGIPNLVAPPTHRLSRDTVQAETAAAWVEREIGWPCLMRPVGDHGGKSLVRLDDADAFRRHAQSLRTDTVYLTRYVDYRSDDGYYRKYRLIFVDGEIFPYHLAIGSDWLMHYFRKTVIQDQRALDEEAAFMTDFRGHIGPAALAALTEVHNRIALDYFGIDCGIDRQGRVLLFECNACMRVSHDHQPARLNYKREPVHRIRQAIGAMLRRRAAR